MTSNQFSEMSLRNEINWIDRRIQKLEERKEQTPYGSKGTKIRSVINAIIKLHKEHLNNLQIMLNKISKK